MGRHEHAAQSCVGRGAKLAGLVAQELCSAHRWVDKRTSGGIHRRHAVGRWRCFYFTAIGVTLRGFSPLGKRGSTLHALRHGNTTLRHGRSRLRGTHLIRGRHLRARRHHALSLGQCADTGLLSTHLTHQHGQDLWGRFHGGFFTNHLRQFHVASVHRSHITAQVVHQNLRVLRRARHWRHFLHVGVLVLVFHLFHVKPGHDPGALGFLGQGHCEHGSLEDFVFHHLSLIMVRECLPALRRQQRSPLRCPGPQLA